MGYVNLVSGVLFGILLQLRYCYKQELRYTAIAHCKVHLDLHCHISSRYLQSVRESSFNMTREGGDDEDFETRSLTF